MSKESAEWVIVIGLVVLGFLTGILWSMIFG